MEFDEENGGKNTTNYKVDTTWKTFWDAKHDNNL